MATTVKKKKPVQAKKKAAVKKSATRKASTKKAAPKKAAKAAAAKKAAPKKSTSARAVKKPTARKTATSRSGGAGKASFKREMTKMLNTARRRILSEVNHIVKSESDDSKTEIGDIYDIASNERERELLLTIGDREREKLAEVEDALDRLSQKTYGECEDCGEPVGENRLRAMPFARVCIDCKSRSERESSINGKYQDETPVGMLEKAEGDDEEF